MSQSIPPAIIDLSSKTSSSVYESNRGNFAVKLLVLHDTVGSTQYPDNNNLGVDTTGYQNRLVTTLRWLQGDGGVSAHYLIGPEALGAPILRLCQENWVAYHAGGSANWPSSWHAPDGTFYQGNVNGVGIINWISIGIERWGSVDENPGPKQAAALLALATDIARRYNLTADQVVSHKSLEGDRQDGVTMLTAVRAAISQPQPQTHAPASPPAVSVPVAAQPTQSPGDLIGAGFNKLIDFLTPKGTPTAPAPSPPSATVTATTIHIGSTLSQGVAGVVPYLGHGTVKNNGTIIRDKPTGEAQVLRNLNQGTALRLSAYTDKGSNNGTGTRWYLIDAADGGGWIYSGSIN
ncbi:MAG: N-acetylmuramoyl-L-alanine amidase [Chloroflexi bacterium]|nr:N-acetylmuramoyl-L-alanine amidase [Chloroflexota bacterium]OJW06286.1 MAG: hypothetical protein BGO39_25985 [Chloroflexi bacterium 54-19]